MIERVFDAYSGPLLLSGASGDLLAARTAAISLLAGHRSPDLGRAVLVLTAVLLHCAFEDGEGARRAHVSTYLSALLDAGRPAPSLSRSPLQFARYAAAELKALFPPDRRALIKSLLTAMADSSKRI